MRCEKITISPQLATYMLENNKDNRPINVSDVRKYARDMANGDWKLTHQGIMFGKNGNIIDGQHRLAAVVKSGVSVDFMVFYSDDLEGAKDLPIDVGRKRSQSFIIGKSNTTTAVCSYALRVINGETNPTTKEISDMYSKIGNLAEYIQHGAHHRPGISKQNVIFVATLLSMRGEEYKKYAKENYMAMMRANQNEMSEVVWSLFKQVVIDRKSFSINELAALAFVALNKDNKNKSRLFLRDYNDTYQEIVKEARFAIK